MTGAYLRVKRGDEWENIEVEHLTEKELEEKFLHRTPEELVSWMKLLCKHLHHLDPLLQDLERDGILARAPEPQAATDDESK